MRVFFAAAVIALLSGPVCAQAPSIPKYGDLKGKSPQDIAAEKEADRAYKKSLGNIPEQAPVDPWGTVRSDNAPKAAAKNPPAKPAKAAGAAK